MRGGTDDPEGGGPADLALRRAAMVDAVLRHGSFLDGRVLEVMRRVPRERFVPGAPAEALDDRALGIGEGQTISAPHMVAIMCTLLDLRPGQKVLEVGTGSGYHAAVMAGLVRPGGRVVGIEVLPALAERARAALADAGFAEAVEVRIGDGGDGAPDAAPFDRVSVAAATPHVPQAWFDQLGPGGRMVVPVGARECILKTFDRTPEGLVETDHGECVFVPLTGRYGAGPS